jgi:uncharacterized protein (DUF1501 family)
MSKRSMNHGDLSRRHFLRSAALGAAAVSVTPILSLRQAGAAPGGGGGTPGKFVVVVNLFGGNDGVNMVVPATSAAYRARRPSINLVDNLPVGETLHALDGNHALHYSMGGLKQIWDDGDLHIVGQVSYPSPNQSHFTSRDIYSYGVRNYPRDGDGRGWLGRFADCYWSSPSDPLGVISVGLSKLPDFRSETTSPLILTSIPSFAISGDNNYADDFVLRENVARLILASEPDPDNAVALAANDILKETYPLVDRVQQDTAGWIDPGTYPGTSIGRYLETISQLLHAQTTWGTQVFYTGFGGFDTHQDQHSGTGGRNLHEALMTNLDQALTAFANDMKARGRWDDCVILVISEFGRRCYENGSRGTDHGWGTPMLVLGGPVRGVTANGGYTNPLTENDIMQNFVPFVTDFRDVYGHVVQNHLGLDPNPLFPDPAFSSAFGSVDLI